MGGDKWPLRNPGRFSPASARELCARLDVLQPTVSRMLAAVRPHIVTRGAAAYTRYALTQPISPRMPSEHPVVEVTEDGSLIDAGRLCTVSPHGFWFSFDTLGWPDDPNCRDGFRDGLPYFVADMQPQGYLGRAFARRMAASLNLPDDPREWRDEEVQFALAMFGHDMPGNLIIGDDEIRRFEDHVSHPMVPLFADDPALLSEYEQMVLNACRTEAGEFPTFIAARESTHEGRTPHVIVKFSGNDGSPSVSRWSDLLVCEHLALETIAQAMRLPAASSCILHHQGRTFLDGGTVRSSRHVWPQGRDIAGGLE